ncbi:MAG: MFS transporter [Chloroflexia bacterium]|nr:MFS transporter [Chloroflexia bacterium]
MSLDRATAPNPLTPLRPAPPTSGLRGGLRAFRHRDYRLLWLGQIVSVTGTWMQSLAQSWLVVTTLGGSALALGAVNVAQFAPILVLGLVAGVIADRIPKRNVLLVTQTIAAILATTLALLVATGAVRLWHVYAIALCFGVVNAFDMPTRQAFVGEIVGKDDLMNAIALNSALFNAGRIVGPAIAGVLLAAYGPAICFGVNAVSYIAPLTALLLMKAAPVARQTGGTGIARLREGLAYVRGTPEVLMPMVLVGFVATFGMNFNIWAPLLAKQNFGGGATGFGLLMSAMGVGSLTGALGLAFTSRGPRRGLMFGAALALGGAELLLGLAGAIPWPLAVGMLFMACSGFAASTAMATANSTVQTIAPDALRGRVMSVYMTVFHGTIPFGALVAGASASWFGAPASVAFGGLITLLAAAIIGGRIARPRLASYRTERRARPSNSRRFFPGVSVDAQPED